MSAPTATNSTPTGDPGRLGSARRRLKGPLQVAQKGTRGGLAVVRRLRARPRRLAASATLTAGDRWVLGELDAVLASHPAGPVAVLTLAERPALVDVLASVYPRAVVSCVPIGVDPPSPHARLAAAGPFRAIAVPSQVAGGTKNLAQLYPSVLFHLVRDGRLLVADFHPGRPAPNGLWPLLHRLVMVRESRPGVANADEQHLSRATRQIVITGRRLAVTNGTPALAKLRESEVDHVLEHRGERAGRRLEYIEAETFRPRGTIRDHAADTAVREPEPIEVPRLSLREYRGAVCVPGQITVLDNLLLPDTYRHHVAGRLIHRRTIDLAPAFAQVEADLDTAQPVEGSIFQWDSEFSGHYGHMMTEQLSRLWAWPSAKERFPDLRVALSRHRDTDPVTWYERGVLESAGINPDEVIRITRPIRPERVVAATPMFAKPFYVSPRISTVWDAVGRGAETRATSDTTPPRIFVSRRRESRWCHNRDEVEKLFIKSGFTVIYPEDLTFADQAAYFRNAELVAGFAGSGMFTLSVCDTPKRVLLLCSEGYIPHNEYMINAVRGHELDVFWSVPEHYTASGKFTFDFDREGRHLRRVLAECT